MDTSFLSAFFDEMTKIAISGEVPKVAPAPKVKATNPTPRVPAPKLAPTPAAKGPALGGGSMKVQAARPKPVTQYVGRGGAKTMAGGYGRMQAAARGLKAQPVSSLATTPRSVTQQPREAATIPTRVVRRAPTRRPARPIPPSDLGAVGQPMNRMQALGF